MSKRVIDPKRSPKPEIESQRRVTEIYKPRVKDLPRTYPDAAPVSKKPRYVDWETRHRNASPAPLEKPTLPARYPKSGNKPAPYSRLKRADLKIMRRTEDANNVAGSIKPRPFVLSSFDARPINCIDFVDTFITGEQIVGDTFTGTYVVPAGRTAIFRRFQLRIYTDVAPRNAVTGQPLVALTAGFFVNTNAVEQASNFRVDDALCSPTFQTGLDIPLYFLAPSESVVTLIITNATGGFDLSFVAPVISGNLLLSEGVNPASEPGTQSPLPMRAL